MGESFDKRRLYWEEALLGGGCIGRGLEWTEALVGGGLNGRRL